VFCLARTKTVVLESVVKNQNKKSFENQNCGFWFKKVEPTLKFPYRRIAKKFDLSCNKLLRVKINYSLFTRLNS